MYLLEQLKNSRSTRSEKDRIDIREQLADKILFTHHSSGSGTEINSQDGWINASQALILQVGTSAPIARKAHPVRKQAKGLLPELAAAVRQALDDTE